MRDRGTSDHSPALQKIADSGPMSRPSTSVQMNGHKRSRASPFDDANGRAATVPLSDLNSWYYPAYGYESDDEKQTALPHTGNWGNKQIKGARWIKKGKMAMWGPSMEDWDMEERTRKRLKLLVPREDRSPSPPRLSHLADPPRPLMSPYPPPQSQHYSYTSFVLDKSVTYSFRSKLLDELEQATNSLIEGEATMRRALGRLWQAINEDRAPSIVTKKEEDESADKDERAQRLVRAPDLTPPIHKLFLLSYTNGTGLEPSHFALPETQMDSLEKSMAVLRELADDGREYVERLAEIGESIGDAKAQRNAVWNMVRERAIKELQDAAASM